MAREKTFSFQIENGKAEDLSSDHEKETKMEVSNNGKN